MTTSVYYFYYPDIWSISFIHTHWVWWLWMWMLEKISETLSAFAVWHKFILMRLCAARFCTKTKILNVLQGNQILNAFAYICIHYCHCFRNDWQTEWGVRFNKQILLLILQWQWVGRRALFWLNQVRNPGLTCSAMRAQHGRDINARANIWSWEVY